MKILKNILLSLLFSITFFVTVFSLTVLNKHFIYKTMDRIDYYDIVYSDIEKDMKGINYVLFKDKLKSDIKAYVKYKYDNTYFTNKIVTKDKSDKYREIYNYHVRFKNVFLNTDISIISSLVHLLCLVLIIITGIIFLKTKRKHNLLFILIFNFIISIINVLFIYNKFNFNHVIFNSVKNSFIIYYFAFSILVIVIYFINNVKKRLLK